MRLPHATIRFAPGFRVTWRGLPWSKTKGQTKTKLNLIYALVDALKKLSEVKVKPVDITKLCIIEGKLKSEEIIPDSVSTKTSVQQQEAIEA